MKRITCIIYLTLIAGGTYAQTSFSHLENFNVGDQATYIKTTTKDSLFPGKAGKNIKWNFTRLSTTGKEVKQTIESSGPVAVQQSYQMVESNSDSSFIYLKKSNDTLYFTAFYDQTREFFITYPQGVPFMVYPINYGQVIMKSDIPREYSMNNLLFKGVGYFKTSFDGMGELKLPNKTYKKVVRIKFEQKFTDTDDMYHSKTVVTTTSYAWFDMESKHSVFKINFSTIKSAYYNDAFYSYFILK
jgi:hypothetical protein